MGNEKIDDTETQFTILSNNLNEASFNFYHFLYFLRPFSPLPSPLSPFPPSLSLEIENTKIKVI